jgi:hypothetical protein
LGDAYEFVFIGRHFFGQAFLQPACSRECPKGEKVMSRLRNVIHVIPVRAAYDSHGAGARHGYRFYASACPRDLAG